MFDVFSIRFIELETPNVNPVSFYRLFSLQDGDTYLCPFCMLAYVGMSPDETSFNVFLIYTWNVSPYFVFISDYWIHQKMNF